MVRNKKLMLLLLGLAFGLNLSISAASAGAAQKVKNIILMISDGCGYNDILATDLYQFGSPKGKQSYQEFPFQSWVSTYSADGLGYESGRVWKDFKYVESGATDSAAAATAMATGVKTYNAAIGVDVDRRPLKTVAQQAEEIGKSTGVITTVPFSHATPAGFVAHNENRNNYEAIAKEMLFAGATDVIMGAGNPWFDDDGKSLPSPNSFKYVGGQSTWDSLAAGTAGGDADGDGKPDPWKLIQTRVEFKALAKGATPNRVCGVAQVYETLQQKRSGDANAAPYVVPLTKTVPTLAEMTRGALNVLDNNPRGFFLMIEGGAVDWAGHDNQSGRMIEEEMDFNRAVNAVNDWVKHDSNWQETVVIVTADHETGYLTGPGSNPGWKPLINMGKGKVPGMQWNSKEHTNSLVPLFAKGGELAHLKAYADKKDPVRGEYLDNTNIGQFIFSLLKN
jgi:alkaline phosphatase